MVHMPQLWVGQKPSAEVNETQVNDTTNETADCVNATINETACFSRDAAMLRNVEPKNTKELFAKAYGASALLDHQKESYLYGMKELEECRKIATSLNGTAVPTAVRQVSNDPLQISMPCIFDPQATLLCDHWPLDSYNKVCLQAAWMVALALTLAALVGSTLAGPKIRNMFGESPEASTLSKDDINRMEAEAVVNVIYGDSTAAVAKVIEMVFNVCTVMIPISNVAIYALATEKTYFPASQGHGIFQLCADWHDAWLLGSICLLIFFQAVRAAASRKSPRFCGSGSFAWLVYLLTDVSSIADSVAVTLSSCSFLYCRAVHWNWMIFSFVRVIESLGHWGVGVNFHGFTQAGGGRDDRRMLIAMSGFGLVMWVLIGSLYYVVNSRNSASEWVTAVPSWQRFESIPSSMFFALLNLYKKNPLALAFDNFHEQLLVIFVNVACVPVFALVAGMIGSAVTNAVCAKDPRENTLQEEEANAGGAGGSEEYEEEEEEEEEQEEDPLVEDVEDVRVANISVLEQWRRILHSWQEYFLSLTWEDNLHPVIMAILGFGSIFFYGVTTSYRDDGTPWFPPWAYPAVDGTIGAAFLADWITSSARSVAVTRDSSEAADLDTDGLDTTDMSLWRHTGYFIASVPGIVHLLFVVANGPAESQDKFVFCLCSLWRIYLLEKWLDHPFHLVLEAVHKHRKALATTGAVSIFVWFLGAHLLFVSEFRNPDLEIHLNYGSLLRSIWASSIFLNGEWVFCDFTWSGKTVGCLVVLFGVSIVVVPMMVFSGEFMKQLLGDFFEHNVERLKAEERDLWQLKMEPADDAPSWRKELFSLLYAHLQRLKKGLQQQTQYHRSRVLREERPWQFQLFKRMSLATSLIFTLVTLMENSQYMNAEVGCKQDELARNMILKHFLSAVKEQERPQECRSFLAWVDMIEARVDTLFLNFFVLEFLLRCIALGWRHLVSELGLAELFAIVGLIWSLPAHFREDALHHPKTWEKWRLDGILLGAVVPLRLCRLVSVGSYFGVVRAVRKVLFIARWPLIKSFYFLVVVWYTHAMLLHFAEMDNPKLAIAGAQVQPAEVGPTRVKLQPMQQSERFGDYLVAMQYSLLHLTGDYPIVKYTFAAKILLIVGLVVGTCAIVVWTAIFSSSMVNYLANEAVEDPLAKAVERRMLLAIEVVTRIQRTWRRRQAARKQAIQEGPGPVETPEASRPSRPGNSVLRRWWTGFPWERFFQITLVVNLCVNMLCSLPEVVERPAKGRMLTCKELSRQKMQAKFEAVCLIIFSAELVGALRAGKGSEGKRWYFYRTVDFLCLLPGLANIVAVTVELYSGGEGPSCGKHAEVSDFLEALDMPLKAMKMIRVLRILFWRQWKDDVQVFIRGVTSSGPILAVPVFMSLQIWVVISSLFVFTENSWRSPSQAFFASVPSSMYWTSSFLIGEWTLADFSPGAGSRVCIFTALFGTMGFAIPMGILMEGVKQSMVVDMMERLPLNELAEYEDSETKKSKGPSQQPIKAEAMRHQADASSSSRMDRGIDRQQQLRRAAKLAAMTRLQVSKGKDEPHKPLKAGRA
ncbi:unnamed protein product [Symbiodinium necroappetens]|uniref:Uncharacterized protein n=1 Tax=Symbiodinium necroappetens TaxID=1628268 RepID=A0A813ANR3_9DINO|nr:unnamed protein product [Symbiodinium necroappetens]